MLKNSLFLLLTAAFAPAVFAAAQQEYTDVQSLQYEFGKSVRPSVPQPPPAIQPCPCEKPVVYAPSGRSGCCPPYCVPVYTACSPCYTPCYRPEVPRRAFCRPVYYPLYYYGCR